jgi:hypothetical protein
VKQEEKQMRKFIVGVSLGAVILVLFAHVVRGQISGTAQMTNSKVTQGDNMAMKVLLDRASNRDGSIGVTVFPEGATNGGLGLSCGLASGQDSCQATARMPLDAKLGRWVVAEIAFTPVSGQEKTLLKHGDLSFQVVAHGEIVLPESATISDIK